MSARDAGAALRSMKGHALGVFVRPVVRHARCAVGALTLGMIVPLATVSAQPMPTSGAPGTGMRLPAIWIGTGVAAGNGSAGSASLATQAGGMIMSAIELPMRLKVGPASMALRGEGRWSQQSLDADAGSGMSGNVQTLSAGLVLRMSPFATRLGAPSRFTPYVLAGVGMSRPSTRVDVLINNPDMPSARFTQTSSEVAPTGMGGLGALVRIGRAQLFAEARTEFASRDAGTLRTSFGTIGIAFQPHR